jgi:hypothetical protein
MNQSETIGELTEALSKVQGKLSHAKKDSDNPYFKSKYADLESVWDACRDLLAGNGLSIMQFPGNTNLHSITVNDKETIIGEMSMTTILAHSSGEWISHEMSMPITKLDPHGVASAITYMRRLSVAAVTGVVPGDDDDGNAASGVQSKSSPSMKSIAKDIL